MFFLNQVEIIIYFVSNIEQNDISTCFRGNSFFFRINDKKDTFSVSVFSLSVVLYRNARE